MIILSRGTTISKQLRPGRHQLSRDEVRSHQRERILRALESVMPAKGYADTSIADVIKGAGVSRQTFYELFSGKEELFLAGWARRQAVLITAIVDTPADTTPMARFTALLQTYLTAMARDPALSRLYLIGVYAAGDAAIAKRLEMQRQFVTVVARVLEARTDQDRFACQALVSAISTLVTNALLEDDPQTVLALHEPLVGLAGQLFGAR